MPSFLDSWRAGDYPSSFDHLHRYFDYTMRNKDRTFYHYALLNLAVLQADFGDFQEAVIAMQESVSVAHENHDMCCLNFSLSWLYHFGKAHPEIIQSSERRDELGAAREGLRFLRAKAKESGMWSLWSSALLSEAKAGLSSGESLATAFANILRSSHLGVTKNMMSNVGAQMLLQSAVWSRLGIARLASLCCETFLRCHARTAPFDDVLKFTCRHAYLLTEKGRFDSALTLLDQLDRDSLRTLKAQQYQLLFRGIIRLKRDLHHHNLSGAELLLEQLLQCRDCDPDLSFELNTLHIEFLIRRGDHPTALSRLEDVAAGYSTAGSDIYCRTRLLIMKAQIHARSGRPLKGFSSAYLAASMAWNARLLSLLWPALCAIAHILISVSEFDAAVSILTPILPRAFENDDRTLNAQLFSVLADAHVGLAGQADERSTARKEHLTTAWVFVDRAFDAWDDMEDVKGKCEMVAKKAVLFRLRGKERLARGCAVRYMGIEEETLAEVEL